MQHGAVLNVCCLVHVRNMPMVNERKLPGSSIMVVAGWPPCMMAVALLVEHRMARICWVPAPFGRGGGEGGSAVNLGARQEY